MDLESGKDTKNDFIPTEFPLRPTHPHSKHKEVVFTVTTRGLSQDENDVDGISRRVGRNNGSVVESNNKTVW